MTELRFRLLVRPGIEFKNDSANEGLGEALERLRELSRHGAIQLEENNSLSDEELVDLYYDEVMPHSVRTKVGLRKVYGSARKSGAAHFGKGVPALLLYENDTLVDIYPRRERDREVTISDFVATLPVPLV